MTHHARFVETGADPVDATHPDYACTKALLECWSEWRGTVRRVLLRHMQPRCALGRWAKLARQGGELWAHNEPQGHRADEIVDDDLMSLVDRTVCALPSGPFGRWLPPHSWS